MNIREYVEQAGITVETIGDDGLVNDGWQHYAYTVRVTNPKTGRSLIAPWMQGLGIDKAPEDQAAEIVDSLISDVWSYRSVTSFEEWAQDLGYDTDSRKAEKIYNAIGAMESGVVALLGGSVEFDRVAMDVERL